jgi:predicted nucleic-acid-binding Zn-ribbon protein
MIVYVCKNCGYELYKFKRIGQDFHGVKTPSEVRSIYGGKCPKCGHHLDIPSINEITLRRRK